MFLTFWMEDDGPKSGIISQMQAPKFSQDSMDQLFICHKNSKLKNMALSFEFLKHISLSKFFWHGMGMPC